MTTVVNTDGHPILWFKDEVALLQRFRVSGGVWASRAGVEATKKKLANLPFPQLFADCASSPAQSRASADRLNPLQNLVLQNRARRGRAARQRSGQSQTPAG